MSQTTQTPDTDPAAPAQPEPGTPRTRIGIMTSGGDAQGMNAAVRAVVRSAISANAEVYAIYEGYQGMIEADEMHTADGLGGIRRFGWEDVGNILHRGGTTIGTFRSKDFRERAGRLRAARNLVLRGIDRLVVIGGDGSLSGLDMFRAEWGDLLAELVTRGEITAEQAAAHPTLMIAGLVGSIDNDLVGSDMTIGADSALHRIIDAIDALASTAASHQRSFVVEVMGRHCGYLALMSAIAGGCDYVLIPEDPPAPGWEDRMCAELRRGRAAGRRESIVVVAEGAQDTEGNPITSDYVCHVIEEKLHEDARVTILGHVQRGGSPSAYDRWASTWLGYEAVQEVLRATPETPGHVMAFRGNRVVPIDLVQAVQDTREVPRLIERKDFAGAMRLRGGSFTQMDAIFHELAEPTRVDAGEGARRIAILHAGGLAPGMNAAARAAVRLGISRGHTMLGVRDGFVGLRDGMIEELDWSDVEGWTAEGGANLGTRRQLPTIDSLYSISRAMEDHQVEGLLVIGGYNAYLGADVLRQEQERYPAFRVPIVCVPASIDNNLPGSELAIGTDSALNTIVWAIDRLKLSGSASTRAFVVETMGRYCGYLAMLGGMATGAERIYLNETGITLPELTRDVEWLRESFRNGRKLFLAVRNERASEHYTTDFLANLLDEESQGRYDVRAESLGHIQQGSIPSPFDRLHATRLVSDALYLLDEQFAEGTWDAQYLGMVGSRIEHAPLSHMMEVIDKTHRRPRKQWWMDLRPVLQAVSDQAV